MSKILVLVDLDQFQCPDDWKTYAPAPTVYTRGSDYKVLFVVGCNQTKAQNLGLAEIPKIASALAKRDFNCEPHEILCEVACSLTMPQTTDVALYRLLLEAPSVGHEGPFSCIRCHTSDEGIRKAIDALGWKKPIETGAWLQWIFEASKRHTRKLSPITTTETPDPLEEVWSSYVDTDGRARAAQTRTSDQCLNDWLPETDRTPHIFSQLACTTSSVRGVSRMGVAQTTPSEKPSISDCSASDGLVLHAGPARYDGYKTVSAATVGIGAVHLVEAGVTVRTKLPLEVIRQAINSIPQQFTAAEHNWSSQARDEVWLKAFLTVPRYVETSRSNLCFKAKGLGVRASVRHKPAEQVTSWWFTLTPHRAGSEYNLQCETDIRSDSTEVSSVVLSKHELAFCSLFDKLSGSFITRVQHQVLSIRKFRTLSNEEKKVLVFSWRDALEANTQLALQRIQTASRPPTVPDQLWNQLTRLPVMVPVSAKQSSKRLP